MKVKKRKYGFILAVIFSLLISSEIILRYYFGFCDAVLFRSDRNFEYIFQPNQSRHRFGNYIRINEFSMRSEPLKQTSLKILGLGDSVMDGGALTDQDSLATTRFSKSFSLLYDTTIQFLSVAVASWGPDNCYAYLKQYGTFGSKMIVMVVSSHDAYDVMNFTPVIGVSPLYPTKQCSSALYEVLTRLFYKVFKPVHDNSGIEVEGKVFNTGFKDIFLLSKRLRIPLVIYLHSTIAENLNGSYSLQGKKIIDFAVNNDITLIRELDYRFSKEEYRDFIHLNESGQKHMYNVMYPVLKNELDKIITR